MLGWCGVPLRTNYGKLSSARATCVPPQPTLVEQSRCYQLCGPTDGVVDSFASSWTLLALTADVWLNGLVIGIIAAHDNTGECMLGIIGDGAFCQVERLEWDGHITVCEIAVGQGHLPGVKLHLHLIDDPISPLGTNRIEQW